MVTWTGDGFTEVKDKATLEYAVTNVPYTGEYNILVRYEPKVDCLYYSQNIPLHTSHNLVPFTLTSNSCKLLQVCALHESTVK